MNKGKQIELAKKFKQMHNKDKMLLLPNAWNGGSAKVFEKQGFEAVATTSAGIAYSKGYPDGEMISFEDLLRVIKEIINVINVPFSVDIERGYSNTIEEIKDNVKKIIETGAVGINIEDGHASEKPYLDDLELQIKKIKAITELKEDMGIPFVINARTCLYWLEIGDESQRLKTAIERGNAFSDAGADCIFVPGALSEETVKQLVNGINAPINIIANSTFNDFDRLSEIGVKRLSIGSGAVRTMFAKLVDIAKDMNKEKNINTMLAHEYSYDKVNAFFRE